MMAGPFLFSTEGENLLRRDWLGSFLATKSPAVAVEQSSAPTIRKKDL